MSEDDVRIDLGALLGAVLSRWLRILTVTLILVALAYAALMFVPKLYESRAGILVEPRENAFTLPAGQQGSSANSGITAEAAVSSQIELIRSRDTLLRVIDQLNLRDVPEFNEAGDTNALGAIFELLGRRPAPQNLEETVLNNLQKRLTVERERDSLVISVAVQSEDPQLAASIANAIAAAHVQRRAELSLQDTAEASVWLEQEIVKLRERVSAAETAVAQYKVQNDLLTGANNSSLVDQQLSNIAAQITNAQERRNTAQSRAALIRSLLEAGQPIDGVPDVQSSVIIQQLTQSKAALQGELAQREATLLANHPTVRALRAQIRELEQQIAAEATRVVRALEVEAQIESDLVVSLQDELSRTKVTAQDATTNNVRLDELEREATAQRQLLESYLLRYRDAIARSDSSSALPDVRVVTAAAPTATPASPKVSLTLGAVAFLALALQVGGVIFGELTSGRVFVSRREDDFDYQPVSPVMATPVVSPAPVTVAGNAPEPSPAPAETDEASADPEPEAEAPHVGEVAHAAEPEAMAPVEAETEVARLATVVADEPPADKPARTPRAPRAKSKTRAEAAADALAAAAPLLAPAYEPRLHKPLEVSSLSADLALGRSRIVMIVGQTDHDATTALADRLVADALHNGLSIARVDAGSGRVSTEPGLTDLAAGTVSFGDVVHRGARDGLAEVPWGQIETLDRDSPKPLTLLEALTDIYEAVVVLAGTVGKSSALTTFSGADCRTVIVGDDASDTDGIEAALSEAAALGYHPVQFMTTPAHQAEVA